MSYYSRYSSISGGCCALLLLARGYDPIMGLFVRKWERERKTEKENRESEWREWIAREEREREGKREREREKQQDLDFERSRSVCRVSLVGSSHVVARNAQLLSRSSRPPASSRFEIIKVMNRGDQCTRTRASETKREKKRTTRTKSVRDFIATRGRRKVLYMWLKLLGRVRRVQSANSFYYLQ